MATQRPGFQIPLADFAASLLSQGEAAARAQLIAEQVVELDPNCDAVVYVIEDQDDPAWSPKGVRGDIRVESAQLEFDSGTLGMLAESSEQPLVLNGSQLKREHYAHLDVRRTVASLAYVPLLAGGVLVGAIELVTYERPPSSSLLASVANIAQLAAPAIASAISYEGERNRSLQSITRVTQMYDLEKVFNSNLEMNELLATIASKVQEVMNVQAANVWMVDGDALTLMEQEGTDPTVQQGARQGPEDGVAGKISDHGEPVLIDDPNDKRLRARNGNLEDGTVFSLLACPLMDRESLVGVLEIVNRLDGEPFDEDDQFVLSNVCETASNALHNASLLLAERKVEILEALVKVSSEITSTLDLNRVLDAVVNGTASVIPYERAAVALEQRGTLFLKALSGTPQINFSDSLTQALKEMLEWASISNEPIHVTQHGDEINEPRETSRAKFQHYFEITGARAFYALPLQDDQGRLGILSFESSDPDFLTPAHLEIIQVLAAQATVALRNASLYREVPFIGLLEPVLAKKRRFMALEKRRQTTILAAAGAVLLFLIFVPIPMRLSGDASVSPLSKAQVMPAVDGVVKTVYVHEGDPVKRGQVLADLEDWDYRSGVAAAQAKYESALSEMNRALAANDGTEAGIQRVQADYWSAELKRSQEWLEKTHLRSPIDGVIATPHIENSVGRRLEPGVSFAEVIDAAQSNVDVAMDEQSVPLLRPGERAAVKLDSFPTRTFQGQVQVVSPLGTAAEDQRVFYARVLVPNTQGLIRAGMQGRAKISAGWHAAGYVLLRRPAMWTYSKIWSWFGW
ncbi:MAG TPA: efflux RND transporter periplasmic adaptor subunit [Terriglobales bacterium]|nr:efflux RND transporter periplasmic adaptor subunit [Terriglobales bacterium]